MSKIVSRVFTFFVLTLVLVTLNSLIGTRKPEATATAAVETEEQVTAPPMIDTAQLDEDVAAILSEYPEFDVSIAATSLANNQNYTVGDDATYVAASISKVLSAVYFLDRVEHGEASLDTVIAGKPASKQLGAMISQSDNTAWRGFNDFLVREKLTDYAHNIGIESYVNSSNTVKSTDIAELLTKLYRRQLLQDEHTQLLLSYMSEASMSQYIPAATTGALGVYHKAGWLDDRFHDAAIIDDGDRALVLVIFSKTNGRYNTARGQEMFHKLTSAIQTTF